MPYIDTTIKEGTLVSDLKDLITSNGWTVEKTFRKISYPNNIISPTFAPIDTTLISLSVAEHTIFKSAQNAYYGIAKVYNFKKMYKDLTPNPRTDEEGFKSWLKDQYVNFGKECILYFYMLEKLPDVEDGGFFGCAVDVDVERGAIDIEARGSEYISNGAGSYVFTYTDYDDDVYQSPFMKCSLRNANLVQTDVATNWWPDSLVTVRGFIDDSTVFIIVQADPTPAFENNVVPVVPIYWGKFESFKEGDIWNDALWGGTAFDTGDENGSHSFDFKSTTPYRDSSKFMPVQKTYPNYPGNGIDNIIVKRAQLGARYQAYYLSWNTAPQNMPPDRVGVDGGQYPLSWMTQANDEYKYKFNPSIYSQKVHTSRAYLIHPDEGVRGYLPRMVVLSPLGLLDGDKLKVRTATCPDQFDIYRFFLTSAISPVTKRPGTAYTPAGIGIYEQSI